MEAISEYVRALAMFIIFSSLIRLIAPSGNFKKYIALVLNLMLVTLILAPLVDFVNGTHDFFGETYLRFQNTLEAGTVSADKNIYEQEQMERVVREYKQELEKKTKEILKTNLGINADNISIRINEDYESSQFGEIEEVSLSVILPKAGEERSLIHSIALGAAVQETDGEDLEASIIQRVKKYLMDFYSIKQDHIYITVQEFKAG